MRVQLLVKLDCSKKVHIGLLEFISSEGDAFGSCGWSGKETDWAIRIHVHVDDLLYVFPKERYCKTCFGFINNQRKVSI